MRAIITAILLALGVSTVLPEMPDYRGLLAVRYAYITLAKGVELLPVKPKIARSKCKNCDKTGKVPSGDGQGWSKCPDCVPDDELPGIMRLEDAPKPPSAISWAPRAL